MTFNLRYFDLEDDDYVIETHSVYSTSTVQSAEEEFGMYMSLARGGREVTDNHGQWQRLEGYQGYVLWNTKYRPRKRPAVSENAYNRARYNNDYNIRHGTMMSYDPVRVEYFINPTYGISKRIDDVLTDFNNDGLPKPYIEYKGDIVYYVNTEYYTQYLSKRISDREDVIAKKKSLRAMKHAEKKLVVDKYKSSTDSKPLSKWASTTMLIFCIIAWSTLSINGAHGEYTGTDDVKSTIIMLHNNQEFCLYSEKKLKPQYCPVLREHNGERYFYYNQKKIKDLVYDDCESCGIPGTFTSYTLDHDDNPISRIYSELGVKEYQGCGIYPEQRYVVINSIYHTVYEDLCFTVYSGSKARMVCRAISNLCSGLPQPFILEMAKAVMHASAILHFEASRNGNVSNVVIDRYIPNPHFGVNTLVQCPSVLPGISGPAPNYEVRSGAFEITGKGYRWKAIGLNDFEDERYPCFNSFEEFGSSSKYKMSIFCRLNGSSIFLLPDYTSFNVTSALKRILGCRTSIMYENIYRASQDQFYSNIIIDQSHNFPCVNYIGDGIEEQLSLWVGLREVDLDRPLCNNFQHFADNYFKEIHYRSFSLLDNISEYGKWLYADIYLSLAYLDDYGELLLKTSMMPHTKKQQRLAFLERYYNKCVSRPSINPVAGFKFEWAKFAKCGRIFISYGPLILSTAAIAEFVKKLVSGIIYLNQVEYERSAILPYLPDIHGSAVDVVSDTSIHGATMAFKRMMDHLALAKMGTSYSLVFSDDTTVGVVTKDGLKFYNIDIASNDTGVDVGQFSLYHKIADLFSKSLSSYMLSALFRPIRVENPCNSNEFLNIKPNTVFMGSGCAQTTGVNNIGNTLGNLVSHKLIQESYNFDDGVDVPQHFRAGFMTIGHEVTVEYCENVEGVQFLKRSPLLCENGEIVMCLNLGAVLRSFGCVDGDLDHIKCGLSYSKFLKLSPDERILYYLSGILDSYCHEPRNEVYDILYQNFYTKQPGMFSIVTSVLSKLVRVEETEVSYGSYRVCRESLLLRYHITDEEWEDFLCGLRTFVVGKEYNHNVLTKIYHYDYGTPL